MSTGLQVVLVIAMVIGCVVVMGKLASSLMRALMPASTNPDPTLTAILALVLRFFVVLALCIAIVLRGGDELVPLVSAAGATYFAAVLVEGWRSVRRTQLRAVDAGDSTGEIEPPGKASKG